MKTTYAIATLAAALLLWTGASFSGKAQDTNRNYVMKTVHASADSTDTLAQRRTVAYYDGLGRPIQIVLRRGSPNGNDLADRTEYDSLGRESRVWQAIPSPYSNGYPVDSAMFVTTASTFHSDAAPFKKTLYDESPLDRIRKVTGPGQAWHTAGKGVTSGYLTNTGSSGDASLQCVKYSFTLSGNTGILFGRDGFWPAGSLTVSKTVDEDGRTLWLFKDMRDLTVLERRLAKAASGNTAAVYADTYYLYDDAGRLTAVLPPELSKYFGQGSWSGSSETDPKVDGFAYQYRYDARGRMVAKKLPGAAWTYYIYDKGDRLVLTQDGNQRERNEWSFRLQDALGRECLTGTQTGSFNAFCDQLGDAQVLAVRDYATGDYGALHGYVVDGMTLPSGAEVLTVNWWDDYAFLGHESDMGDTVFGYSVPESNSGYGARYEASSQGLLTGHWSRALGEAPNDWSTAVCETWYYDDHGREVRHVKGYPSESWMTEQSGYAFSGERTALGRTMHLSGSTAMTEAYTYSYDGWGRPLETSHVMDGGSPIMLASNGYDAVGRLSQTLRGGTSVQDSQAALASSYAYNVRDWLTGIEGPLFSETLFYETKRTGNTIPEQWSGDISSAKWKTSLAPSDSTWYDYGYDLLGRLTEAEYGCSDGAQNNYGRSYSYDLNGNIKKRHAYDQSALAATLGTDRVWSWVMQNGNQAAAWTQNDYDEAFQQPVNPGINPYPHPGNSGNIGNLVNNRGGIGAQETPPLLMADEAESYTYDSVGNRTAILDAQGDTLNVMRYNLLNLPEEYVTCAGDTVKYVYSADGEKLFVKEIPAAGYSTGTEYAANYRIENETLKMIHTDAGYYTPMMSLGGGLIYLHFWYLKDHLGNNRIVANGNGSVIEAHDYDPFGVDISVLSSGFPPFPTFPSPQGSPYKYGGKEWNATTSTYDFEARQLSPAFHRFTTMDPLAEKYYGISPYAYCANNPINLVDPDGCFGFVAAGAVGGAVIGGLSSGGIAIIQRKSVREVIGATVGGAVSGAITGAVTTATFGGAVAVGAIGEGIGSAIEQAIVDYESISIQTIAKDAIAGATGGGLSHGAGKIFLNKIKQRAISSVDVKYASEETQEVLTKEVKKEMSSSGQALGKAGKQQVKAEVNKRIKDYSTADKAMIEMGYFVTRQEVGNKTTFGTEFLYDFLYDQR